MVSCCDNLTVSSFSALSLCLAHFYPQAPAEVKVNKSPRLNKPREATEEMKKGESEVTTPTLHRPDGGRLKLVNWASFPQVGHEAHLEVTKSGNRSRIFPWLKISSLGEGDGHRPYGWEQPEGWRRSSPAFLSVFDALSNKASKRIKYRWDQPCCFLTLRVCVWFSVMRFEESVKYD